MSAATEHRDLLARALQTIERLENQLHQERADRHAPVAVVGVGCRFPGGVHGPAQFWHALMAGTDLTTAERRRTAHSGGSYLPSPAGAYLDDIDRFDHRFFGVGADEAAVIDPQQRILFETAWEALEDAGLPAESLRGTATGVLLTLGSHDYWQVGVRELGNVPPRHHAVVNNSHSTAAARLSYLLGVRGASLTLDAGCSSGLLGVHLAAHGLRTGELDTALVGAVNLMMTEDSGAGIAESGTLAPDGRCRSFDAAATGFGIGEGCGVVVLKRLADARRDGDRVLAVVRGSATNQNGAAAGYGVPTGAGQREVMRAALADAGVPGGDVSYVETHGTGTPLGDVVELRALAAELLPGRPPGAPLVLGAVKTNTGHLFAASGVAGLIKAVLCLHHGQIPGNLHYTGPHPDLGALPAGMVVPTAPRPWPRTGAARVAGVSAFAAGGSNAHVVLSGPEPPPEHVHRPAGPVLVVLSTRDGEALRRLAARLADHAGTAPLADLAYTAARRRSHLSHRAALVAADHADLARALRALAADGAGPSVRPRRRRTVWCLDASRQALAGAPAVLSSAPVRELLEQVSSTGLDQDAVLAGTDDPDLDRVLTVLAGCLLAAWWRAVLPEPDVLLATGPAVLTARYLTGESPLDQVLKDALTGPPAPGAAAGPRVRLCADPTALRALRDELAADHRHAVVDLGGEAAGFDAVLLERLGRLHCAGVPVRWESLYPTGTLVDLPTYPWRDDRHWWGRSRTEDRTTGGE